MNLEIDEPKYKPDIELLDRYQRFSSEILKLSLLGIAIFGSLVKIDIFNLKEASIFIALAIVCFGFSSGSALAHRFYSTKGFFYHIRFIRKSDDKYLKNRNICFGGFFLFRRL